MNGKYVEDDAPRFGKVPIDLVSLTVVCVCVCVCVCVINILHSCDDEIYLLKGPEGVFVFIYFNSGSTE